MKILSYLLAYRRFLLIVLTPLLLLPLPLIIKTKVSDLLGEIIILPLYVKIEIPRSFPINRITDSLSWMLNQWCLQCDYFFCQFSVFSQKCREDSFDVNFCTGCMKLWITCLFSNNICTTLKILFSLLFGLF